MIVYILAILTIILDQVSKWYVQTHFRIGESIPVIPDIFHWTYIVNHGAAFGILMHQRWIFLLIVALLVTALYLGRHRLAKAPLYARIGTGSLLGGALGNGWDRLYLGGVVDFFDFRIWPIFNVADIAICIGVPLLILYFWSHESQK